MLQPLILPRVESLSAASLTHGSAPFFFFGLPEYSINFGCVKHSALFAVQQYQLISCQNDISANWL